VKLPSIEYFNFILTTNYADYDSILSMLDKEKLKGIGIFTTALGPGKSLIRKGFSSSSINSKTIEI